jgi:hypothetical protein
MQESGSTFSLALPHPDLPLQTAVVDTVHRDGLLAVGPATSIADAMLLLRAGVDGLMHVPHDQPPSPELVDAFAHYRAFVTPTLATYCSGSGDNRSTHAFLQNEWVENKLDYDHGFLEVGSTVQRDLCYVGTNPEHEHLHDDAQPADCRWCP